MAEFGFEDFAGGGGKPAVPPSSSTVGKDRQPSAPAAKPAAGLTFSQFAGTDAEEFQDSRPRMVLESVINGAKKAGGEFAALADFVFGMPGFLTAAGAQLGGTVQAAARRVPLKADQSQLNPVTAYTVGREARNMIPEWATTPIGSLMKSFQSGEAYEHATTTQGMAKLMQKVEDAGKWVEEATGGRIARDAVPMFVDTLMAGATGLGSGKKPLIDKATAERLRTEGEALRAKMMQQALDEAEAKRTAGEAQAHPQTQQTINSMLGIRTPAEQAQVTRQRRKDIQAAFKQPGEGSDYGSVAESQFKADERLSNETERLARDAETERATNEAATLDTEGLPQRPERIGQAEILRILQKPGYERTAEDLITLRQARVEEGGPAKEYATWKGPEADYPVEILGKPEKGPDGKDYVKVSYQGKETYVPAEQLVPSKQRGAARPEVLNLLAAAGIGTAVGANLDDDALRGATLGGATGLAAVLPFLFRGESVPRRFRQSGAVKDPGGMWHPEAVERLTDSLYNALAGNNRSRELYQNTTRLIGNYLNKYAGTARDPLKDVEIPFGEGTKRWEEVWEGAVNQQTAGQIRETNRARKDVPLNWVPDERVPNQESIWNVDGPGESSVDKAAVHLRSYLSHVGDYLRQNVKPEDLPKYDLTRAVRETAENDRRVAKAMEKAAADSTKTLPVYKEYPDGMRWVEIKAPEKLTAEQAKGVRRATKDELNKSLDPHDLPLDDAAEGYVAVDANGKPITNSYTGQLAAGATPEEAYLAGRLAEEGNQMVHCVGGYCEGVAAGESRIFSLRDKKGQSHVTVEVEPPRPYPISGDILETRLGPEGKAIWEDWSKPETRGYSHLDEFVKAKYPEAWKKLSEGPDSIIQIKGKQNRAPNKEYLPYVQDFVKGGKWGEVGDLENTGLKRDRDLSTQEQAVASVLFPDETLFDSKQLDQLYEPLNQAIREGAVDIPARIQEILKQRQGGFADQRLVMGLGAASLGGLLGSYWADDPVQGAILGSIAGGVLALPNVRGQFKSVVEGADKLLGPISTRIMNISPQIHKRMLDYERRVLEKEHAALTQAVPWMRESTNLPASQRKALDLALLNNDPKAVADLMKGNVPLLDSWRAVRNLLTDLGEQAKEKGRFKELLSDYFPRRVKDFEGLMNALDKPIKDRITKVLEAEEAKAASKRGAGLTDTERDAIINRELKGYYRQQTLQPGYAKQRTVKEVTPELAEFYYSPQEGLYITIGEVVKDMEMARLFGKELVQGERNGRKYINVDMSIGNLLGKEMEAGKISPEQFRELEGILRSRFGPGERSPNKIIQNLKNLSYAGLLGDIPSAIVQLGDPSISVFAQGLVSTMTAVARKLTGNKQVGVKDFGLADHVAEELAWGAGQTGASRARIAATVGTGAVLGGAAGAYLDNDAMGAIPGAAAGAFVGLAHAVGTANALHKVLRQGVFTPIDTFGKDVQLGAAFDRYTGLAQTPKGVEQIKQKYGQAFGAELPQVIADLKKGEITEPVRSLLFAELSRTQPISKLEVPQAYLDNPNGRIMWQLKTFMLKQADIIRRDAYNEIKRGNVGKGLKNLTEFSLVLGVSGATTAMMQDWLLGRDPHWDGTDVMENVLKTFGMGEYVRDQIRQGKPVQALGSAVLPPWQMMERILTLDPKAVQYIPVVGQLFYNWEMGGREAAEAAEYNRKRQEAKREGREYTKSLTPRTEQYLERRKEERRMKREREGRN